MIQDLVNYIISLTVYFTLFMMGNVTGYYYRLNIYSTIQKDLWPVVKNGIQVTRNTLNPVYNKVVKTLIRIPNYFEKLSSSSSPSSPFYPYHTHTSLSDTQDHND